MDIAIEAVKTTPPTEIVPEEEVVMTIETHKETELDIEPEIVKEPAKLNAPVTNLDVCFLLDCTGSMQSHVDRAKNKIKDIIEEVKQQYPESEIKVGIIGYRDVQDTPRFDILPFTSDIESARRFLDAIRTSGGGDTPEDVNGAFQKALQLEWEGQARMIVHIADAPCHGRDYHNTDDCYPNGHPEDQPWQNILQQVVDQRMDYLFLKINLYTDKMFNKFKEISDTLGAEAKGVMFKQENISNVDTNAQTRATIFAPYVPMPVVAAKKETAAKREIHKEKVKAKPKATKTRKSREAKKPSKKAGTSKTPARKSTTRKAKKDDDDGEVDRDTKSDESDDEEVEDATWVQPKYWTRSKARQWDKRKTSTKTKKEALLNVVEGSDYWVVPIREGGEIKDTKKSTRKTRTKRSSVSKEKERSEEKNKSRSRSKSTRGRGRPKGSGKSKSKLSSTRVDEESDDKLTKRRAFVAPEIKTRAKPLTMSSVAFPPGMSALDEQEYFAKLMARELKETIGRKTNGGIV